MNSHQKKKKNILLTLPPKTYPSLGPRIADRREGAVFGDFVTRQNATASAALGNAIWSTGNCRVGHRGIGKNAENKGQFVLLFSLGIFNV